MTQVCPIVTTLGETSLVHDCTALLSFRNLGLDNLRHAGYTLQLLVHTMARSGAISGRGAGQCASAAAGGLLGVLDSTAFSGFQATFPVSTPKGMVREPPA
jgi:hypothetical protein